MIRSLSCICLLLVNLGLLAQEQMYPVADINPALLENANAVVREHETEFAVLSPEEAVLKVRKAVTVLNEKAKGHATLYVWYDKLIKINQIKATVYDASGRPIKKLKKSDIQDISAINNFSIFEDNRAKVADLSHTSYPYTVEYEYEMAIKNMLFSPKWHPQEASLTAVESARFQTIVPADYKFRYKEVNLQHPVSIAETGTGKKYSWEISNLPAVKREPHSVSFQELVPMVLTGPSIFNVQGYSGDMSTWKSFGAWNYELNHNRDQLPLETVQELEKMVGDIGDEKTKIKTIYEYLQGKTRYVSVQLGIGGWQSFEASLVDQKSYGDCKALSNYTKAMLKSVGIKSYYTLIHADKSQSDIHTDFPSNQFNHVILCVPMEKDTIWLECTNQQVPFGFLGTSTTNRHALMVTESGGHLVKTPNYSDQDNRQVRSAEVQIVDEGHGMATVQTEYHGLEYETVFGVLNESPENQKKWLYQNLDIPSFEVIDYAYSQEKKALPVAKETLKLALRNYASSSGKRMFLTPNLANRRTYVPPATEDRKTEVVTKYAYTHDDTVRYILPEGFHIEFLPESESFQSPFGSYSCTFEAQDGQLVYTRRLVMYRGRYPADTYGDYREFLQNVAKADKIKMVLKSAT